MPEHTADRSAGQAKPPKPTALPVIPEQIPDELKARPQWIVWRYEWNGKKWDKPPRYVDTGKLASSTDASTWATFADALSAYHSGEYDGIGYVFSPNDPYTGIDFDHCLQAETGNIDPDAYAIVERLHSYTEYSPSGGGLHTLGRAKLPGLGHKKPWIEVYDCGRYFTCTGHHLKDTPLTIEDAQAAVTTLYQEIWGTTSEPRHRTIHAHRTNGQRFSDPLTDEQLLMLAQRASNGAKFTRLWAGDTSAYAFTNPDGSRNDGRSEADQALCGCLGFFSQDEDQLDRLMRQSGLSREKWANRGDYRNSTIRQGIDIHTEYWTGTIPSLNGQPNHNGHHSSEYCDEPMTLPEVVAVFEKWLYMPHLIGALHVLLGTYAANRMLGDPLWLMLVGGSGWGKTELLMSITRLPSVYLASTLTEASLLSGTSRREKGKDSTGGILRKIGEFGYLLCKDFTSILSMNRESSTAMLAALREIFDGEWTRHVGVDGGRTLGWKGKLALIAGCTGAIDRFHAVVGALGERFVSFRLEDLDATEQGTQALGLVGKETEMRKELSAAVSRLFADFEFPQHATPLDADEIKSLVALASLAALCRSAVVRDYRQEIELILDQEAPSRLVMSLSRLYTGMQVIGVPKDEARPLIYKVAMDCIPALRRAVFDHLAQHGDPWKTQDVATDLGYPYQTTKRTLEDLAAHGVVWRKQIGKTDLWELSDTADALFLEAKRLFYQPPQKDKPHV